MRRYAKIAGVIAVFGFLSLTNAALADALSAYDDDMNAVLTLQQCKVDLPPDLSRKDSSTEAKFTAMGFAAWQELLTPLDARDSAHHEENGHEADRQLKQRTVAILAQVRDRVAAKGCDALVPDALAAMRQSVR